MLDARVVCVCVGVYLCLGGVTVSVHVYVYSVDQCLLSSKPEEDHRCARCMCVCVCTSIPHHLDMAASLFLR